MSESTPEQRLSTLRDMVERKMRVLIRDCEKIRASLDPLLGSCSADELEYILACLRYIDIQAMMGIVSDAARSAEAYLRNIERIRPKLAPERIALFKSLPVFQDYQAL